MKKKRIKIKMLVAIIVVISILSTAVFVRAFSFDSPQNGDIVSFGSYPQSEVKDENLLKELNKLSLSWKSYDYYSGNDVNGDGIGDYGSMNKRTVYKYADLFYEGERYRAVLFSQYRPYVPFGSTSSKATNNYQIENGYFVNNTYFFKYEPLMWRVLDADDGLLLSEKIIDCQPFSNTVYMYGSDDNYAYAFWDNASHTCYYNNYSNSSLRKWLNDNFYNTSFYDYQKYNIKTIVSLNPIMIDGTGMCGGCRLTLHRDGENITKFACVDGPDFNGYEVDFDEAMSRGATYKPFEREAHERVCNLFKQEVK